MKNSSRILYIEDDDAIGSLFKAVAENAGHRVDVALNGKDGIARHQTAPYDIVALDYQLPDMTG